MVRCAPPPENCNNLSVVWLLRALTVPHSSYEYSGFLNHPTAELGSRSPVCSCGRLTSITHELLCSPNRTHSDGDGVWASWGLFPESPLPCGVQKAGRHISLDPFSIFYFTSHDVQIPCLSP